MAVLLPSKVNGQCFRGRPPPDSNGDRIAPGSLPEGLSHQQAVCLSSRPPSRAAASHPLHPHSFSSPPSRAVRPGLLFCLSGLRLAPDPQPSAICITLSQHSCLSLCLSRPPAHALAPASLFPSARPTSEHQLLCCSWGCSVGLFSGSSRPFYLQQALPFLKPIHRKFSL